MDENKLWKLQGFIDLLFSF